MVTHASRLKPYFIPLPLETTADFPETETADKFGKLSLQDSNQEQPGPEDYDDDDVPPPPPHQHWLRGEQKPRNFELFEQVAPPPVSRQSSSLIPPTRQPSQTFQPPLLVSRCLLRQQGKRLSLAVMTRK